MVIHRINTTIPIWFRVLVSMFNRNVHHQERLVGLSQWKVRLRLRSMYMVATWEIQGILVLVGL